MDSMVVDFRFCDGFGVGAELISVQCLLCLLVCHASFHP